MSGFPKANDGCIKFVRNLNDNVDEALLTKFVRENTKETLVSALIARQNGISRNFGFLTFSSAESANIAEKDLNDKVLEGKKISVINYCSNHNDFVVRIKDLPANTTEAQIKESFSKFGKIDFVTIDSQFFTASIKFTNSDDANNAVREMNNSSFNGKTIQVTIQSSLKSKFNQASSPYVKSVIGSFFPSSWGKEELTHFFVDSRLTPVEIVKLNYKNTLITFATPEEAKRATELNGSICCGNHIKIEFFRPIKREPFVHSAPKAVIRPLTKAELSGQVEDVIDEIGNRIYDYISTTPDVKFAGKITGMILESYKIPSALNELLYTNKILEEIRKAKDLLFGHNKH